MHMKAKGGETTDNKKKKEKRDDNKKKEKKCKSLLEAWGASRDAAATQREKKVLLLDTRSIFERDWRVFSLFFPLHFLSSVLLLSSFTYLCCVCTRFSIATHSHSC